MLPVDTPRAVRDRLQSAITQVVNTPETKKRLEETGYDPMTDTPEQFAKFLREDVEAMAKLIKQYNLKPE
jgi:tripartite-type tricarboxylate transporter receptor subunit TctC